ncbi:MAG: hypothetical protein AAFR61_07045 [Bacteroidota bacterium]
MKEFLDRYDRWRQYLLIQKPHLWASGLHYMLPLTVVWALIGLGLALLFSQDPELANDGEELFGLMLWPAFLLFGYWLFRSVRVPANVMHARWAPGERTEAFFAQLLIVGMLALGSVGFYFVLTYQTANLETAEELQATRLVLDDPQGSLMGYYPQLPTSVNARVDFLLEKWERYTHDPYPCSKDELLAAVAQAQQHNQSLELDCAQSLRRPGYALWTLTHIKSAQRDLESIFMEYWFWASVFSVLGFSWLIYQLVSISGWKISILMVVVTIMGMFLYGLLMLSMARGSMEAIGVINLFFFLMALALSLGTGRSRSKSISQAFAGALTLVLPLFPLASLGMIVSEGNSNYYLTLLLLGVLLTMLYWANFLRPAFFKLKNSPTVS